MLIYKPIIVLLVAGLCCGLVARGQDPAASSGVNLTSSDTALQRAFAWAKGEALHFQGKPGDPVGPWYESALPPRYAFCMRDASHQCTGAEILGMSAENKNMFTKFVDAISSSRNWCGYWEINKWNKPAPEDYLSDREFWYNLDANFDVLYASWRLYVWTGDKAYIDSLPFTHFDAITTHQYIQEWILSPDSLLTRPVHPNAPVPYNEKEDFDRSRGLPSYCETVQNQRMGVDLVAAMYRGLKTYASILRVNGELSKARHYEGLAEKYRQRIETDWWDGHSSLYWTYYTNEGQFGRSEGEDMLLWFGALQDSVRKHKTIEHMTSLDWNVESQTYFPYLLYREGYWDKAYAYMMHLSDPATKRRDYPEVSYGVVEGVVQGLMGVSVVPGTRIIETVYRSTASHSALTDLPILQTTIDLQHLGNSESMIRNSGVRPIVWKATFMGHYSQAKVGQQMIQATSGKDEAGQAVSYIEVKVAAGEQVDVKML